jgi:hypothetical protein
MDPAAFFTELKRRKVYRVAVAYAIVAWLLIQATWNTFRLQRLFIEIISAI